MKWELNENKYASGPAQTSSILKALKMEDEKRPRKTGSLNESMQMNEWLDPEQSERMGIALEKFLTPEEQEEVMSTYGVQYLNDLTEDEAEEIEITYHLPPEWWDEVYFVESMQLSGTSKLNGRRNLRRGKENPDNIKTAGNKTRLTGDYDLRESAKTEYQDPYNDKKTWEVTDYDDGHRYLKQKIAGKQFGRGQRTSKKRIKDIGIYDMDKVNEAYGSITDDEQYDLSEAKDSMLEKITSEFYSALKKLGRAVFVGYTDTIDDLILEDVITFEDIAAAAEKAIIYYMES